MPQDEDLAELVRQRVAETLAAAHLTVVILGPGQGDSAENPDYEKRRTVHHFLRDRHPDDRIALPEEEISAELIEEAGIGLSEAKLVELSDLVLALIPPAARTSGVFAEILDFCKLEGFTEKLWVFRPTDRSGRSLGYAERRVYEVIDESRFIEYSPHWWLECNDIRAISSGLIESARKHRLAMDFS